MLRTLVSAVIMTVLGLASASATALTFEPAQNNAVVAEYMQNCTPAEPNFGGYYNVCSVYAGTNIRLVFLANIRTGKVIRLPDAELGIEIIEGDGTSVIVYNPDFSAYSWMAKLPDRIWCETYTLDQENGTLTLTEKTKMPLYE
jgi:hypothetical protein